ncbi:hypothetical protein B484DRAFT_459633 [Ochromonadaceae sp. CCMP2298]|nr:hypothetical protein B484DRAFT_459633 [Ochromonadaceae sp. CCMP2298]
MYYCYLLRSLSTPQSSATYIGFSTDPAHRLRQHNGELVAGARKTSQYRPWRHVAVVGGFPNKITALQFEWAWQNPLKSRNLDSAAIACAIPSAHTKKGKGRYARISGRKGNLKVLTAMVSTPLWRQLGLILYFADSVTRGEFDALPASQVGSLRTSLIDYSSGKPRFGVAGTPSVGADNSEFGSSSSSSSSSSSFCSYCQSAEPTQNGAQSVRYWTCTCGAMAHVVCAARICSPHPLIPLVPLVPLIPRRAQCNACGLSCPWSDMILRSKVAFNPGRGGSLMEGGDAGDGSDGSDSSHSASSHSGSESESDC